MHGLTIPSGRCASVSEVRSLVISDSNGPDKIVDVHDMKGTGGEKPSTLPTLFEEVNARIKEARSLFFTYRVYGYKCPNCTGLGLFPAINSRMLALVPKKMGKYIHLEKLRGGPESPIATWGPLRYLSATGPCSTTMYDFSVFRGGTWQLTQLGTSLCPSRTILCIRGS